MEERMVDELWRWWWRGWSAKEGTAHLGCCRLLEGEGKKENQRERERRVYKYKGVFDYYKFAIPIK